MQERIQKLFTLLSVFGGLIFATPVFAADVFFNSKVIPSVDNLWVVQLKLNSPNEKVNTIGGIVKFPSEILKLNDIRTANSILNFWVEGPKLDGTGVKFAGITPGGFQGENGELLTLIFQSLKKGNGELAFENGEIYLNDGKGTKAELKTAPFNFSVAAEGDKFTIPEDKVPPQNFEIKVGRNETLYDGKWFAVFATQDKETAIDHYEINEGRSDPNAGTWKMAISPFVLSDQSLNSYIHVKAVDKAGNFTVETLAPTGVKTGYRVFIFWGILSVFIAGVIVIWRKMRGKKSLKIQ